MLNRHSKRNWAGKGSLKVKHLAVPTFFLCILAGLPAGAVTNWVDGTAYGTNYSALAHAGSIASKADGSGSLIIGSSSTTNLSLGHAINGFIAVTNRANSFSIAASNATLKSSDYAVLAIVGGTNTITGGHFIGTTGTGGSFPPLPNQTQTTNANGSAAMGGLIANSTATIIGSEFAGAAGQNGLMVQGSSLVISNGIFRGGDAGDSGYGGSGLRATDASTVTIYDGSFTGKVGNTAFYLKDSNATVYDGTFVGNVGGSAAMPVAGDGLFSILSGATTNHVTLYGGDFSSLAFYGATGSVQHFLAGTNLVVHNGIIQNGGTVVIDNQNNAALQEITLADGRMEFDRDFTLGSNGVFNLFHGQLAAASNLVFASDSSLNFVVSNGYAQITADTATFQSNSTIQVYASSVGLATGTNNIDVLVANTGIFVDAGSVTNPATTAIFGSNVNTTVTTDWLTLYNGYSIEGGNTLRFQLIAQTWGSAWATDGQPKDLANELQTLDDGTMAAIVSPMNSASFKAAIEETYFTTMNTFQTALQGLNAAVGQSASRGTEFRELLKLPTGAKGPEETTSGNDWRGWGKYYGQFLSHDADGLNQKYDATLHGGVIGADHSFGNLLIGLSGGAGNYHITGQDNAEERINAYHGSLYGTYGAEHAYLDTGIAYGFNQVESQTSDPFILNGDFNAQVLSAYLGGGY
ncbi:MAG: autotransporter outer membrane beta-barrel domain-containing protein, partial [Kiritimatiellales bacterium]|nr:autotransporter outer membrane beta-barrel domain-containing protein [Kiritimatiellales bacterium]